MGAFKWFLAIVLGFCLSVLTVALVLLCMGLLGGMVSVLALGETWADIARDVANGVGSAPMIY